MDLVPRSIGTRLRWSLALFKPPSTSILPGYTIRVSAIKLRNGGVVDSDDFSKSWLVNRVVNFRSRRTSTDEEQYLREEEAGGDARPNTNRWGTHGISVAADDTLDNHGQGNDLEGFSDEDDLPADAHQGR